MAKTRCRADLHVHSHYSDKTRQWFFRKMGAQESYTPPERVYTLAKARGMTFVTITDHDAIEGALEIAHHRDVFVSEEITTHFPNDLSNIHVVALDITEAHHAEITRCRQNIYELVEYLNTQRITHYLAHPMFASGAPITVEKLEKLLLLFKNLEVLNGSRVPRQQDIVVGIARRLTPEWMEQRADRYGIAPVGPAPHRKSFVGGSDDHAGLSVARACTVTPPVTSVKAFLKAIDDGQSSVEGEPGTALSLANSVYVLAYELFRRRNPSDIAASNVYTSFFGGLRAAATPGILKPIAALRKKKETPAPPSSELAQIIEKELHAVWKEKKPVELFSLLKTSQTEQTQRKIFEFVNEATNRVLKAYGPRLTGNLFSFDMMEKFETLGVLTSIHLLLFPYYLSFRHQTGDRALLREVERHFGLADGASEEEPNIAVFSDSIYDVNGAALSLRHMVETARKNGRKMTLVGASNRPVGADGPVMNFAALWDMALPEYDEIKLYVPPLLEMLDYCDREGFTAYQISSPGPVGLCGLLIARLLNRPAIGHYHTHIPQFVHRITEDASVGEVAWTYVRWFYSQMDRVLAPSENAKTELINNGFDDGKLHVLPYGIDAERFHPGKRNTALWSQFGINGTQKLLYVGRLSREKNLSLLAESFKKIYKERNDLSLVIVGDGPYRQELQRQFNGYPVYFTGYLDGEKLASVYASSDLFVFPSTTDTSGNVVLEAQASGLPVIVSGQGGPKENMVEDHTGLVVEAINPESFSHAIRTLLDDPTRRAQMGRAARIFIESSQNRRYETVVDQMLDLCR
ncbi:MAG: glycosyltransferase [candidate division Zixibacteria bacterium]|nr:glycosyltransferase [candidate division Zixibacteria bacterium]